MSKLFDHPDFDLPRSAFQPVGGKMRLYKKDAAAPDPRLGEASLRQVALSEKYWDDYSKEGGTRDWLKGITEDALGIQRTTANKAAELSDYQLSSMKRNDDRYWNTAVPYENALLEDVKRFDSQEYKDSLVNNAVADVNTAGANTRQQMQRGLTRMGVNPNSGAFSNMANATSLQQATAMAAAANKTRMAADQIGLSTKMQMYGGMKGLAGLGATNAGLASGAMGLGLNAASGMNSSGAGMIGANNSTFGSSMSGMSAGINSGIGLYGAQANAQAQANQASGEVFGSILGAGTQLGAAWLGASDRRLKTDIKLVGQDEGTGLNLYEFRYKDGSGKFVGVMADEVEPRFPEAVYTMLNGYKAVNYAYLGIEMAAVQE